MRKPSRVATLYLAAAAMLAIGLALGGCGDGGSSTSGHRTTPSPIGAAHASAVPLCKQEVTGSIPVAP